MWKATCLFFNTGVLGARQTLQGLIILESHLGRDGHQWRGIDSFRYGTRSTFISGCVVYHLVIVIAFYRVCFSNCSCLWSMRLLCVFGGMKMAFPN